MKSPDINRRRFICTLSALAGAFVPGMPVIAQLAGPGGTVIPSSKELIPRVGLGSWVTFNVGNDPLAIAECTAVIKAFLELGGSVIDSSPMYGSSQATIGKALRTLGARDKVFAADKVWTRSASAGRRQFQETMDLWGLGRLSLLQVHNLVGWQEHLPYLQDLKAAGTIKYIGVTTSHGRRHGEVERIIETQPIDFVQLSYNITNRDVENRLLPAARDNGVAVIANRPFAGGRLIRRVKTEPFPQFAREMGLQNWADLCLKYILSHPAMTCAIPATTRTDHVRENMKAMQGELLETRARRRILDHVLSL